MADTLSVLVVWTAALGGLLWLQAILLVRRTWGLWTRLEVLEHQVSLWAWAARFERLCARDEAWRIERGVSGTWHVRRTLPPPVLSAYGASAREAVDRAQDLQREFTR